MKTFATILLYITLTTSTVIAETTKQESLITGNNEILSNSFRVIWGLLIVLGIILLLYGLLRKRFSILSSPADKEIKILEIKPLMGKKALCLVEIRGEELLLGISESQITHLTSLSPKKQTSFSETLKKESGELHE